MISLLKILRVYGLSASALGVTAFGTLFLVIRSDNLATMLIVPSISFMLALMLACLVIVRNAHDPYVAMTPYLHRKIQNLSRGIILGALLWMSSFIAIYNLKLLGLVGIFWLCVCIGYYFCRYSLETICMLVSVILMQLCARLAIHTEIISSIGNSLLSYCVAVGLGFFLLIRSNENITPEPGKKRLSYWLNELYPHHRDGELMGTGFHSPNWALHLYFPHSFMVSGMLLTNICITILIVVFVGLTSFYFGPHSLILVCFWYVFCVGIAASFDRAGKIAINVVDYQMLSLAPLFRSRMDFVNKLLLSFIKYIILFSAFVSILFVSVLGALPKFSLLLWSICILAPLSIGSLSCLVISATQRSRKFILWLPQVMAHAVLALVVFLKFDALVDFLLVTIYLLIQITMNFYLARKQLIQRDWA